MATDQDEIQIEVNDNELVTDLKDLAGVQKILDSIGVSWDRITKSARLELALIRLGDLSNIPKGYKDPQAKSELDRLISYIKRSFEAEHGWKPTIGKNRLAGSVEGSPYTGGGWGGPYTGGLYTGAGGAGPYTGGLYTGAGGAGPYTGGLYTGTGGAGPYTGGLYTGAGATGRYTGGGGAGPYTGGGGAGPYTGGGGTGPYTGGGGTGPYTGGGGTGPYTGGDFGYPQWMASGGFPERTHMPARPVRVGILDTRLFPHPDLAGRYLAVHDALVPATCTPTPDSEAHATFIAGVVLDRAPSTDLIVGHVLNAYNISASSWDVATRMAEFAAAGVDVLNISFGAVTHDNQPPLVLTRAVKMLRSHNVIVVAAAGNHGPGGKQIWPAALKKVVAVGAGTWVHGDSVNAAKFSPDADWVNLLAPGEDIHSLYKAGGYAVWNGTSFAAAAVSGAIAHLIETRNIGGKKALKVLRTPPTERRPADSYKTIHDIGPKPKFR
jgi:Subtilase family